MQQPRPLGTGQGRTGAVYQDAIRESALSTNKVLRNTYLLLAATLIFSAIMATVAMVANVPYFGPFVTLGGYFALLFLTYKFQNSAAGLICVFALTGFMGLTLAPLLSAYLQHVPHGGHLVLPSLATTRLVFPARSSYVLRTL